MEFAERVFTQCNYLSYNNALKQCSCKMYNDIDLQRLVFYVAEWQLFLKCMTCYLSLFLFSTSVRTTCVIAVLNTREKIKRFSVFFRLTLVEHTLTMNLRLPKKCQVQNLLPWCKNKARRTTTIGRTSISQQIGKNDRLTVRAWQPRILFWCILVDIVSSA